MPDDMDRAADLSAAHTEACITAARREVNTPGALICDDCEEPIPARRRASHPAARRCVPCQTRMEAQRIR